MSEERQLIRSLFGYIRNNSIHRPNTTNSLLSPENDLPANEKNGNGYLLKAEKKNNENTSGVEAMKKNHSLSHDKNDKLGAGYESSKGANENDRITISMEGMGETDLNSDALNSDYSHENLSPLEGLLSPKESLADKDGLVSPRLNKENENPSILKNQSSLDIDPSLTLPLLLDNTAAGNPELPAGATPSTASTAGAGNGGSSALPESKGKDSVHPPNSVANASSTSNPNLGLESILSSLVFLVLCSSYFLDNG